MDAKTIFRTLIAQTKQSLLQNDMETTEVHQKIAELQQKLNTLAQQHYTLIGEEQAYNKALTVLEKTEAAPPAGEAAE